MSMTRRAEVRFTVKEFESGQPWIAIEQLGGDEIDALLATLGFDLRQDATREDAQAVAQYLNQHVTGLSETK